MKKKVVIIQGPTAVGKSSIAMKLAKKFQTDIISADSRQVYKHLNIGTAKPSSEEQTKIKHHLIDIVTPNINYNAGDFVKDANAKIELLTAQNKIPLIVGGTGFYILALLDGLFKSPEISQQIRENLEEEADKNGLPKLYKKLSEVDPVSANRIEFADKNRIIRALEIYEATGKTITQLWKENKPPKNDLIPFNILITDDRQIIYDRINKRVDKMLKKGLLNEIKALFEMGYKTTDPGLNTVGYRELFDYFFGDEKLEESIRKIKKNTRNFAKRQLTWYRKKNFDLTLDVNDINILSVVAKINKFVGD